MPAVSRLTLVFAALVGLFVLGVGVALATLLSFEAPGLPVVAGIALVAGVVAALITYVVARTAGLELDEDLQPPPAAELPLPDAARSPLEVKAMPVADLPQPYVAAVMKGLQASRHAQRQLLH